MLNKPEGIVATAKDDQGRDTVLDLVPIGDILLHPVGRLDADSQGLILLTNDGHLTQLLTHPSHQVEKEYLVGVSAPLSKADVQRMVRGVKDRGEVLRVAAVKQAHPPAANAAGDVPEAGAWLLLTLHQGRNREIRRLIAALGREVVFLRRIRIATLYLGALGSGAFRELTEGEVAELYEAARRLSPGAPPR